MIALLRYTSLFLLLATPISNWAQEYPGSLDLGLRSGVPIITDTSQVITWLNQAEKLSYLQPDSAIALLGKVFRYSRDNNHYYGAARCLLVTSKCFEYLGNTAQSRFFAEQAYHYCRLETPYKDLLTGYYYERLGNIEARSGNIGQAINYYFTILKSLQPRQPSEWELLGSTYNNLGITWMRQKQYDKALYYLEKGVAIARQHQLAGLELHLYTNIGAAYLENNDLVKGQHYSEQAHKMALQLKDARMIQITMINLGNGYLKSDPEQAISYFKKVLDDEVTDPYGGRMLPYSNIGEGYTNLGDYKTAAYWLTQAIHIGEQYGLKSDLKDTYQQLANVYAQLGHHKQAYTYQQLYSQLSDSLVSAKQVEANQQLEVKYRTAEKDKEIATKALALSGQQSKIREQQIWLSAGGAGILLLSGLLLLLYRNARHRRRLQQEQMNNMEQQQEISALKAMMQGEEQERGRLARELHDGIVSQLAAAKLNFSDVQQRYPGLQGAKDFDAAINQLDDAALDLRNTAHNLMPDILLQQGFVPALALYCERMSRHAGFRIYFHLSGSLPELDADAALSVYRVIQELIQNILKHAQATQAVVQINTDETLFLLTVEDNGRGMKQQLLGADHLLKTVRTRINTLNGTMDIRSRFGKGATISIELEMDLLKQKIAPIIGSSTVKG